VRREDDGAITLLTLGLLVLVLMVLGGVTEAARAFLAQRSLAGVCDGAAVGAVQGLDRAANYAPGSPVGISEQGARRELARWLRSPGASADARGSRISVTGLTTDARGVAVTCSRELRLRLGLGRVTLRTRATARLR
jgi:Flp pilus assembly protein TadG